MMDYIEALKLDKDEAASYYKFSRNNKTEQQKVLETLLLAKRNWTPNAIADIACGGGGLSLHLAVLYPNATFSLVDANKDAVQSASEATNGINAICSLGDIYHIPLEAESQDLVICWQTLSWLSKPELAVQELIRICKPGGRILMSSLFNIDHDVDVCSTVVDHTRASSKSGVAYEYNTYSIRTVKEWISKFQVELRVHKFDMPVDLQFDGKGLGTYTLALTDGRRLQLSAGMLLNWAVLEIEKNL